MPPTLVAITGIRELIASIIDTGMPSDILRLIKISNFADLSGAVKKDYIIKDVRQNILFFYKFSFIKTFIKMPVIFPLFYLPHPHFHINDFQNQLYFSIAIFLHILIYEQNHSQLTD